MTRYFFVGLGTLCIVVAIVGFAPNLRAGLGGEVFIPPIVHAHGAIMLAWLVLFTLQAALGARRSLTWHRRSGWAVTAFAAVVWISMGVATIVALQRFDPDELPFLVKPLLIQLGIMVVFPIFVTWAVYSRRQPDWHKRLMAFATYALVQSALDRMDWLPDEGLPMFWHAGLRLYILMIPLFAFDIVTLRRIHPATLTGFGLIVAMHAVVSFYWQDEGWNQLARSFWMWLR